MKKVIALSSLLALSTTASAFDYKISLEGRGDFVNGNYKTTAAGVTSTEKYSTFSNNLVRLNMMGTINDNLTYRLRYRLVSSAANPSGTANGAREVNAQSLDYLYADHKNEYFTLRFGKQNWVDALAREGYVSGTDVFIASQANADYNSAIGVYRWGLTGTYKFAETNNLILALSNPNSTMTDTTGVEEKNNSLAMAAMYNGSFMDKMFQPTFGYTLAKQDPDTDAAAGATTKKADFTLMSAGFRSEVSGFTVDADYKIMEKENRNSGTTTTFVKTEAKSIYGSVAYSAGDFTPIAYYINDKFDSETNSADFKRNAFAFGTYYKPFADVNFRYHAMFTNDVKKFEHTTATTTKITDRRVYFGFKADI